MRNFQEIYEQKREDEVTFYMIREKNDRKTYRNHQNNDQYPLRNYRLGFGEQQEPLLPHEISFGQQISNDHSINSIINQSDGNINISRSNMDHSAENGHPINIMEQKPIQNPILIDLLDRSQEEKRQNIIQNEENQLNHWERMMKIQERYQQRQIILRGQIQRPQQPQRRIQSVLNNQMQIINEQIVQLPAINEQQPRQDQHYNIQPDDNPQQLLRPQILFQIPRQEGVRIQDQRNQNPQQSFQERSRFRNFFSKQNLILTGGVGAGTAALMAAGKKVSEKLRAYNLQRITKQFEQDAQNHFDEQLQQQLHGQIDQPRGRVEPKFNQRVGNSIKNYSKSYFVSSLLQTANDVFVNNKPWRQSAKYHIKTNGKRLICSSVGEEALRNVPGGRFIGHYLGAIGSSHVNRQNVGKVCQKVKDKLRRH